MKLLLDTEAFILWSMRPDHLPNPARTAIAARKNQVFLSMVSPWEMQIKFGLGKLQLRSPPVALVKAELIEQGFSLPSITLDHIHTLSTIPEHHRDPFDRLLVAQAMCEDLQIVTRDEMIKMYPVNTLWN